MATPVTEAGNALAFTATNTIAGRNKLLGIFVSTTSGGTIAVSDGATNRIAVFTPLAATFYPLPFEAGTSIVLTVTGTLAATAFYSA
jgi:hypothetical protein